MKFFTSILIVSFFFTSKLNAQDTSLSPIPKRIYTTKKLVKTPVIDGDVSEDAWDVVPWSSDFVEKNPDEGTAPTYQTKFKVMFDEKFLYIALRALDDQPELIQQRLSRRDGFAGDRINVRLVSKLPTSLGKDEPFDLESSGQYLIQEVTHSFDPLSGSNGVFYTTLRLMRYSYGQKDKVSTHSK